MKILITGGTGFIGAALCHALTADGHELTVLSRVPDKVPQLCGSAAQALGHLQELSAARHFDAIINLAGEGIAATRWTPQRKQLLKVSRIGITQQLLRYIERAEDKPEVLISGSAVGFYGDQGQNLVNEATPPHDEFAHQLCAEWESSAQQAENYGVRVCIIRTGLVIGSGGGFLQRLLPPFKWGLGGRLGDGTQWMPWIHRDDYLAIVRLLLTSPTLTGVFNGTAPNPVTNAEFTDCLAKVLHRPALVPVPAFALRLLLGEMAALLLGGQRAIPERLLQTKFTFQYPSLEAALRSVV